jgi:hypothetical protein
VRPDSLTSTSASGLPPGVVAVAICPSFNGGPLAPNCWLNEMKSKSVGRANSARIRMRTWRAGHSQRSWDWLARPPPSPLGVSETRADDRLQRFAS